MYKYLFLLLLLLPALGCGTTNQQKAEVPQPKNPEVREFNQQLGKINDQQSAEQAVNTFVDYVDSRLDKNANGPTAQSLKALMTTDLVKEVARQELLVRQGKPVTVMAADGEEIVKPPIDLGSVTDTVNRLGADAGVWVDDETVKTAKDSVETSIPNLNPGKKGEMTPLNAMVVGYAIGSRDDGSAPAGSVKLPSDKVGSYVTTVCD
jgi:hypothetical protein